MSPLADQSAYAAPEIQELFEWVPRQSKLGTCGPSEDPNCPFMPLPDLENYFKTDRRASRLLHAVHAGREHHVSVETLEKWYIRAFTILILIGKGHYIDWFTRHPDLQDRSRPLLVKPAHFPTDPSDPDFWEKFSKKQFTFYAHNFQLNADHILDDSHVLPIVDKQPLGSGGSAAIYKIKLHPFYDKLGAAVGILGKPAQGRRPANTYVLKTYNTSDAKRYYDNEVEAFKKIASKDREDKSVIQFLGSYKQGDTYNILLEYADRLTLEDFFRDVPPPTLGKDIALFWQRLFNLLKALSCIHTIERPDELAGPDILIGWHQDVKPKNVLVLSGDSSNPYDVHFKLADLGLSHFKRTQNLSRSIADSDVGGTKDYGAPECYRSDDFLARAKVEVQPQVDIWSLGGIYSEAVAWVVLGMAGLTEYRNQRQQEVAGKNTSQDGRPFHDGQTTLTTVVEMHERFLEKDEVRPGDYITKPVLTRMIPSMLSDHPYGRHKAIVLWTNSQSILKNGQKQLETFDQPQSPPSGNHAASNLHAFDQRTPEKSSEVSYRGAEQLNGPTEVHDPPPFDPRYSSKLQSNGQSFSLQQPPMRRPGTWHDPRSTRGIAPDIHNMDTSSPSSPSQFAKASPPLRSHTVFRERMNARPRIAEESTDEEEGEMWHGANVLESEPVPQHDTGESTPPESRTSPNSYISRQIQNGAGLHLQGIQESNSYGPPPRFDVQYSNTGSNPMGQMPFQPMSDDAPSEQTIRRSPPHASASPPPASESKSKKPSLSFAQAKKIREKRAYLTPEAAQLLDKLKDRDHVFLIDDSLSMRKHWDNVIELFSVFAWHAKSLDSDGFEMFFTLSPRGGKFKNTTRAMTILKSTPQSIPSNIDLSLNKILRKYQGDLERQKERKNKNSFWPREKEVKPLSLYVFTDGAWEGCDAVAPVEAMIEKQKELKLPREQIGIQFIRFGDDPRGIDRLQYLDSGLREKYGKERDIVDHEPFIGGNVLKMFLGPVFNWYDEDEAD